MVDRPAHCAQHHFQVVRVRFSAVKHKHRVVFGLENHARNGVEVSREYCKRSAHFEFVINALTESIQDV